jgi:hypothetical protein
MKRYDNIAVCLHGTADDDLGQLPAFPTDVKVTTFAHIVKNDPTESTGSIPQGINHYTWSIGHKITRYHLSDIIVHGHKIADAFTNRHANRLTALHRSVLNKKSYEITHNQRFDLVLVMSFRDLEHIKDKMRSVLVKRHMLEWGGIVRSSLSKDHHSNGLWMIDESLFIGRSADIDTMSRLALAYEDGTLWKMTSTVDLDPAYRSANLGALLWKWASIRNIAIGGV